MIFHRVRPPAFRAEDLSGYGPRIVEEDVALLEFVNHQVQELDKELKKIAEEDPESKRLMTIDGIGPHANARMGARDIRRYCTVNEQAEKLLETAINKLGLSARAYSRVLKVAHTIADFPASDVIQPAHSAEAIQYRSLDRRA